MGVDRGSYRVAHSANLGPRNDSLQDAEAVAPDLGDSLIYGFRVSH